MPATILLFHININGVSRNNVFHYTKNQSIFSHGAMPRKKINTMSEQEITLTIKFKRENHKNPGAVRLKPELSILRVKTNEGKECRIGGTILGGYELSIDHVVYYASPDAFWDALAPIFGLESSKDLPK